MPICPHCLTRFPEGDELCVHDGTALAPDAAYAHVDRDLAAKDVVGEYTIEGKLGEGGFGAVYAAVHPVIGKRAAVKVLSRTYSSNPAMVSRFIAEARAVNQIRHRNIIDIFSFGQLPDGRQYYVMELLDGMTFDAFLAEHGRLAFADALPILRGIARALDAAHGKSILHRDLKPENVYLVFDEDGGIEPKLLDFGLVKLLGAASGQHKTKTGTPMGTPNYMSPEQCRGKDVDARTDVYAFGVMAFEVLTGRLPFEGDGPMDVLFKHIDAIPPAASSVSAEVPAALDGPLARILAKDPDARPASVGQALESLLAAARAAGAPGVPASSPDAPVTPRFVGRAATEDGAGRELASARTLVAGGPHTLLVAESDVAAGVPRPKPTRAIALVAVAALLIGAGGVAAVSARKPLPSGERPRTGLAAEPSSPRGPPSEAPLDLTARPAVGAMNVAQVRLDEAPVGATVTRNGAKLGVAPGPFPLPVGTPVKLVVSAAGYRSREIELTPTADTILPAKLEKLPASKPGSGTAKGKPLSKDLEEF
jgi:hypothetical protein